MTNDCSEHEDSAVESDWTIPEVVPSAFVASSTKRYVVFGVSPKRVALTSTVVDPTGMVPTGVEEVIAALVP